MKPVRALLLWDAAVGFMRSSRAASFSAARISQRCVQGSVEENTSFSLMLLDVIPALAAMS